MFKTIDGDGDGLVTLEEFSLFCKVLCTGTVYGDGDGDGDGRKDGRTEGLRVYVYILHPHTNVGTIFKSCRVLSMLPSWCVDRTPARTSPGRTARTQ